MPPLLFTQVTRIVLLWVNNHFNDFEGDPAMTRFLEEFEKNLEDTVRLKIICFFRLYGSPYTADGLPSVRSKTHKTTFIISCVLNVHSENFQIYIIDFDSFSATSTQIKIMLLPESFTSVLRLITLLFISLPCL